MVVAKRKKRTSSLLSGLFLSPYITGENSILPKTERKRQDERGRGRARWRGGKERQREVSMKFVHFRDHEEKCFIESLICVCFNLWGLV